MIDTGITMRDDHLRYGGDGPDPWGSVRTAFHAETRLRRNDFAIAYNAMVRAGVAAIGTTVKDRDRHSGSAERPLPVL